MSSKRGQKPEDRLWYVHAPGKSEKRAAVDVAPPSNIPYLNGVMDTDEEINKRSEIYFKPTDSDFVKLSKMGGREDLLIHKAKMGSKEPVGYAQTPWWADMLQETEASKKASDAKSEYVFTVPAWFAHQEQQQQQATAPVRTEQTGGYQMATNPYAYTGENRHEKIPEPTRYGVLRNHLNPIKMKSKQPPLPNGKMQADPSSSVMPHILSDSYQSQRPSNYKEWHGQQTQR